MYIENGNPVKTVAFVFTSYDDFLAHTKANGKKRPLYADIQQMKKDTAEVWDFSMHGQESNSVLLHVEARRTRGWKYGFSLRAMSITERHVLYTSGNPSVTHAIPADYASEAGKSRIHFIQNRAVHDKNADSVGLSTLYAETYYYLAMANAADTKDDAFTSHAQQLMFALEESLDHIQPGIVGDLNESMADTMAVLRSHRQMDAMIAAAKPQ